MRTSMMKRTGMSLMALVAFVAVLGSVGCGGRQTPPAEGSCHPWREWVPPQRDSNGQWRDGYCRERGAT